MVNIRIYVYCDTLLVIFCMRVFFQNSGTYCMVPSDWDLALTCICCRNFRSNSSENFPDFFIWEFSRSNSSENSPDFWFVCLFVWLNKTRTVKALRRFHSWSSIFTQDGLAFSTKTARRVYLFVCLSTPSPLCICNRDKRYVWWRTVFIINCFGIELLLCDFVVWHFLHCCFLQVVSLWSLSIWIRSFSDFWLNVGRPRVRLFSPIQCIPQSI